MSKPKKKYTVYFTRSAAKEYKSITDTKLKKGVSRIIEKISENPYQFKKLTGPLSHLRSAKTFSFRVLYQIEDKKLVVTVVAIGHRKDSYRR